MSKAQLLRDHKIGNINNLYWNLSTPTLYEEALMRGEGQIAHFGPFIVETLPTQVVHLTTNLSLNNRQAEIKSRGVILTVPFPKSISIACIITC